MPSSPTCIRRSSGIRRRACRTASWWSEFSATPDQFLDAGSEIVVLGRYRGVAKGTGKLLDVPFVHVWTVADGKATRFRQFVDTAGWVDALSPV